MDWMNSFSLVIKEMSDKNVEMAKYAPKTFTAVSQICISKCRYISIMCSRVATDLWRWRAKKASVSLLGCGRSAMVWYIRAMLLSSSETSEENKTNQSSADSRKWVMLIYQQLERQTTLQYQVNVKRSISPEFSFRQFPVWAFHYLTETEQRNTNENSLNGPVHSFDVHYKITTIGYLLQLLQVLPYFWCARAFTTKKI